MKKENKTWPAAGEPCGSLRKDDWSSSKEWGSFPELTKRQNEVIHRARELGWAVFYPVDKSPADQAFATLRGARAYLKEL